jgi:hypothetical protein
MLQSTVSGNQIQISGLSLGTSMIKVTAVDQSGDTLGFTMAVPVYGLSSHNVMGYVNSEQQQQVVIEKIITDIDKIAAKINTPGYSDYYDLVSVESIGVETVKLHYVLKKPIPNPQNTRLEIQYTPGKTVISRERIFRMTISGDDKDFQ